MRFFRVAEVGVARLQRTQQRRAFGGGSNRVFGGQRERYPVSQGYRGGPPRPTEPQLVAKLLELFPVKSAWIPVSKWVQTMPDDVREALVTYNGLGTFVSSQSNFFIVRSENGVKVVSLSTMGAELCRERAQKEKQARKHSERPPRPSRRASSGSPPRGRFPQRIQ